VLAASAGCGALSRLAPPPVRPEGEATLVAVGDVMLGRRIGGAARERGADWLFGGMHELLDADLTLANLESPLADPPPDASPSTSLAAGSDAADLLAGSGLRIVSLANNHALDAGPAGLASTLEALRRRGVVAVGAGSTAEEATSPRFVSANGVRVAFLAFADVPARGPAPPAPLAPAGHLRLAGAPGAALPLPDGEGGSEGALEDAIARARGQADVVVVAFHWGEEYSPSPTPRQRHLADLAVRAGAQLVVGSHPHVAQPVEYRDGAVVAYSLGNFVFDQRFSRATTSGLALRATLTRHGLGAVEVIPLDLAGLRPEVAGPASGPSASLAYHWTGRGFEARPVSAFYQAPPPEADLDGDGEIEAVEVAGGVLRVLRQRGDPAEEVWRSDPGWDVERAAVGDVDGDGRPEVVFSLWRVYQGRYGNQPFVFGWRDGEMRPVWRGSAVADPIRELAVGDVDGDGVAELVVLEGDPAEGRGEPAIAVAVWRWSGWGFVLQWRSAPGRYSNLRLTGLGEEGLEPGILVDGSPAARASSP